MFKNALLRTLIAFGLEQTFLYWVIEKKDYFKATLYGIRGVHPRHCPICGYSGFFRATGTPPRFDARCPSCYSLERQRLFVLMDQKKYFLKGISSLLHFAPEIVLERYLRARVHEYASADLYKPRADRNEDIENISLPNENIDAVFCSHVLEHVDDKKALKEIFRILKPGGIFITMVPICEGWHETYENAAITDPKERDLHFGQYDHVRYYGSDFIKRLESAGFNVSVFVASPADTVKYGLQRGEKIFFGTKPR